jgi:hypothetical protein
LQIAREEPEPLTGLNRRAGEDDSPRLAVLEHVGGGGNGEIGLACPGRTDTERQIVLHHRVHIAFLAGRLGLYGMALGVNVDFVGTSLSLLIRRPPDGLADVVRAEPILPTKLLLQ